MVNVSKRKQPDQKAENSQRPPMFTLNFSHLQMFNKKNALWNTKTMNELVTFNDIEKSC